MSKFLIILILIFSAILTISAQEKDLAALTNERRNLMPVPASFSWKNGRLPVTKDFSVAVKGKTDQRLKDYIFRVMRRLEGRTVMSFSRDILENNNNANLLIETNSTGNAIPQLGDDESYKLEISNNQAKITASNTVGAMRGLETFLQLLEGDKDGFYFPAVSIDDKPRFPWRGLMIDSARHFQPLEVIKRNLDGMAAVKMNVLHWHLTEDQGFRVETKKYPELHLQGSDGDFYTQNEIKEIINYAADRGIRVMPEFDMPGHATAWVVSHPEIASAPGPYTIERRPGIFDPTLDPTNEQTYKLLEGFFSEMTALFPDKYMHIGGDENEGKQWDANPKIQAFMKEKGIKDNHELQTYFNKRILPFLQKGGKIMMGWDEIFQPDLPKEVVIHSWRGQKALAEAAKQGFQGVLSNGFYIDLMFPASDHYKNEPIPADTTLTAEEQKRILGGEATMWSEWVSPETIDSRIWTRTAAVAERLWSPREVTNVEDMYRRLEITGIQLEELGLTHIKNQAMLLRRLTGNKDISALQTLVSVIEPVKEYRRYQQRQQTMLSPLTGLIDAAQADAKGARMFNLAASEMLLNKDVSANSAKLKIMFAKWRDAGTELETIIQNSPALHEGKQLAPDLKNLGEIGVEIISYMEKGSAPTAEWRDAKLKMLDEIAKPKAAVEFQVVESIRKIINAASEKKN
jgi:hexosaminidase